MSDIQYPGWAVAQINHVYPILPTTQLNPCSIKLLNVVFVIQLQIDGFSWLTGWDDHRYRTQIFTWILGNFVVTSWCNINNNFQKSRVENFDFWILQGAHEHFFQGHPVYFMLWNTFQAFLHWKMSHVFAFIFGNFSVYLLCQKLVTLI